MLPYSLKRAIVASRTYSAPLRAHRRSFRVSTASGLFYNNNSRLPNTHRCYCRAAKGSPHTKTPPNPNVESTVVDTQASFSERLAKRIARSGLCSRRTAEEWIRNGRVKVDGVTTMSLSVNVNASNVVQVDDQVISTPKPKLYIFNKKGNVSLQPNVKERVEEQEDPENTDSDKIPFKIKPLTSVLQLAGLPTGLNYISYLEPQDCGLVLLTNDGILKQHLESFETRVRQSFRVRVFGRPTPDQLEKIRRGVTVGRHRYEVLDVSADQPKEGVNWWVNITVASGRAPDIKHIFKYVKLQPSRLIRTSFGPYTIDRIPPGAIYEVPIKRELLKYTDPYWRDELLKEAELQRKSARSKKSGRD